MIFSSNHSLRSRIRAGAHVYTISPLTLYGVNEMVEFIPQVSQYLYLDYSPVTDNHWSILEGNE